MDEKFKEVKYYEIDYGDFDEFIEETFGKPYECVADNEWNNYSSYDISVDEDEFDEESFFMKYTKRDVERWLAGAKSSIPASDLLEYLAWQKKIPMGEYLIKVFW